MTLEAFLIKKQLGMVSLAMLAYGLVLTAAATEAPGRSAGQILLSFVEDFRSDPAASEPIVFGVVVKGPEGGDWHVVVSGRGEKGETVGVELHKGRPASPSFLYMFDLDTLRKIDNGEMNALTAMGRARMSDPAPMDVEFTPGFTPDADFLGRFLPFTFHFWTRGFPEAVSFGKPLSREVHGANMVVLYYQKGLRSAWAQVEKGQHVNGDPKDQTNPFPTMLIGIRGRAVAKIGGVEKEFRAGQMVFIPAGVTHEAWNPYDEPAEIILLMFGDGA
jgi:mannose-6-phosphate isomerase-like protein (cupin superfamily)